MTSASAMLIAQSDGVTATAVPKGAGAGVTTDAASGGTESGARAWEGASGVMEAAERAGRWINQSTPP